MLISLVTVTFNSAQTLHDTIQSVLSQTYSNIEYIIIDGGSTDNTLDIIKECEVYFEKNLVWISEKDNGIYDAMNKGIRMATGDVIGVLNSDDLLMDINVIQDVVELFDENTDAIFGNLYFVKYHNINSIVRTWRGSAYGSFRKGWHPAHPTFYVRRKIYERYGLFDTSFDVSADFELMLRFIEKFHIRTKYMDRYMVKMRVGGESTGSLKNIIRGNRNIMRAFKKNKISVSPLYPIMRLFPKVINLMKNKFGYK